MHKYAVDYSQGPGACVGYTNIRKYDQHDIMAGRSLVVFDAGLNVRYRTPSPRSMYLYTSVNYKPGEFAHLNKMYFD